MDEQNIVKRLLIQGEDKIGNYREFDYESLPPNQLKTIKFLSLFSKYKGTIIKYIGTSKSSVEEKIAYLEKNSMKLGVDLFSKLEQARLEVNNGYYIFPYLAGSITVLGVLIMARFSPMTSRLYREFGYSALLGFSISSGYIYYQKLNYWDVVNQTYDSLEELMEKYPHLRQVDENQGIIKNFGNSIFNSMDENDVTNEWDEVTDNEISVFDGTAEEEAQINRDQIMKRFTG
ncbi:unnamed protein product [Moneuplotes crassus]|uniref:Transmembrane protein n=1 Tax=Euplotes crassus TaxID=5936 RepID=A0AAD1XUQ1_EUPCR|nr:unnamed protein product [Moneuplotes crassus]